MLACKLKVHILMEEYVMNPGKTPAYAIAVALLTGLPAVDAAAQPGFTTEPVTLVERNLGGPRLGITIAPGDNAFTEALEDHNMGRTLSQFGWHFEYQVIPDGGGPQFVIQFVPMVGGVEYGKFIPSGTLAMGVRFPTGIEFGMGPNAVASEDGFKSALMVSVGKSFNYGGVSIPLNLVYVTNPDGARFSIIFGYAIAKARESGR